MVRVGIKRVAFGDADIGVELGCSCFRSVPREKNDNIQSLVGFVARPTMRAAQRSQHTRDVHIIRGGVYF